MDYLIRKQSLLKNSSGTIQSIAKGQWGPYHSQSPKMNEIARLEFELAYYDVIVQYVSLYVRETLSRGKL